MDNGEFDPNSSIGYYADNVSKVMRARLNRQFQQAGHDVTTEQWKILVQLWMQDGQNQQELSEKTEKNKVSTTHLIDGLEKRNLVVRIPDQNDRRVKRIFLTAKGKELQVALTDIARENNEYALQGISPEDLEKCKSVLRQMLQKNYY